MPKADAMERAPRKPAGRAGFFCLLARRGFLFHAAGNALFGAGCAVGAAVLSGALLVGASLKESVRGLYPPRLGDVRWALTASAGPFGEAIADSISARAAVRAAPVLPVTGSAGAAGSDERVHRVNIIGVDGRFWGMGGRREPPPGFGDSAAAVNSALAKRLGIRAGDQITLRFGAVGALAADAPFGARDGVATLKLPVGDVIDSDMFGDFSLKAEHFTVYNVFIPLKSAQAANRIGQTATAILISQPADKPAAAAGEQIMDAVRNSLTIRDAGLNLRRVAAESGGRNPAAPSGSEKKRRANTANNVNRANKANGTGAAGRTNKVNKANRARAVKNVGAVDTVNTDKADGMAGVKEFFEIYSDRVFIGDALKDMIVGAVPGAVPVSTWFVNSIDRLDRSTPYSFVTTPPTGKTVGGNRIELGDWLARDLNASVGDVVTLTYFVPRPVSGLRTDTATFVVSAIHGAGAPWIDRSLMPPYPGLADAGSCADWDPSIPIDLAKIRPKDEEYWNRRGGAPKAVIGYDMAQRIWGNRFGASTAVRVPIDADGAATAESVSAALLARLTPADCGIRLTDVRASIDRAVENGTDFAPLFLGLSFFTFAASLLLVRLLSTLQAKSREDERTILSAVGYPRRHIMLICLSEGIVTLAAGTAVGAALSPLYTLAVIEALKTVWHAAAMTPALKPRFDLAPILCGGAAAFVCALASMAVSMRPPAQGRRAADAPRTGAETSLRGARVRAAASVALIVAAPFLLALSGAARSRAAAAVFFVAGAALLAAMLCLASALIDILKRRASIWNARAPRSRTFNARRLALISAAREKKRVLGEIMILACALYILGTTQLFHNYAPADPDVRSSGTGGFALYGELNSGIPREEADEKFLLERGVSVSAAAPRATARRKRGIGADAASPRYTSLCMRLRDGDDASCLNLNRAESPVLLGADQELLDRIGAFSFASTIKGVDKSHPWRILGARAGGENAVYGVADANTIEWGLGKSVGDSLTYVNDSGDTLRVVLAGALRNSVLQGRVVIAESDFVRHFPSVGGYRALLLDAPPGMEGAVAGALLAYHDRSGLTLESTADRLNAFNAVENAYLSIFAALGMMGLTLGCAGMGIIVMRGMEERRGEIALLMAQGFSVSAVRRMLLGEHALVAAAGTIAGLLPAVIASGAGAAGASALRIAALLAIVMACGFGSILLGLRGLGKRDLLKPLREEA